MATGTPDTESAFEALPDRYARYANLENAGRLLSWDQQVMMPDAGTPARSAQLATLSAVSHETLTAAETARLLEAVEGESLDDEAAAVVREVRSEYERAEQVPESLVQEIAQASSDAQPIWRAAKSEDDFEQFAPTTGGRDCCPRTLLRRVTDQHRCARPARRAGLEAAPASGRTVRSHPRI
jgi:carboxypeptidase Taq